MSSNFERNHLSIGLRKILKASAELTSCPDVESIYKRSVELARSLLSIERGVIFIIDGEYLQGTYGTNREGLTTDEHQQRFMNVDHWRDRHMKFESEEISWLRVDDMQWDWDGEKAISIGEGWIVVTPIYSVQTLIGYFVNDTAITKSPLDPTIQELLSVFCSLLGSILERKHIERILADERNLLRTLIDSLPDYIFVKDNQGKFILSNTAHARAAGVSNPDDFIGKTAHDFFPQALADQYDADDRAVMQKDQALVGVERITLDDEGNRIWVATTKVPLRDSNGNITGLVGISRDVTAYKLSQEALKQQEGFLWQVVNTNPNLIFVKDVDGNFTLVNKAFAEMFGTTWDDLLGKRTEHIVGRSEEIEQIIRDDAEVINTLQPKFISEQSITNRVTGQTEYFQTIKMPLLSTDGKPKGILVVATNITQRRQAEALLVAERRLLRTLIDNLPAEIFIKDTQSRFMNANTAVMRNFGVNTPDELIGKRDLDFGRRDSTEDYKIERTLIQSGQAVINRERYDPVKVVWRSENKVPIRDDQGEIIGLVGFNWFITERKQAEEALRQAYDEMEERVRQRTAELSHANELLSGFRDRLKALNEVSLELTACHTFDELCRMAVELGREKLGFDRLGIWFIDDDSNYIIGSFGTDETGQIRDERYTRVRIKDSKLFEDRSKADITWEHEVLEDHQGNDVGYGWKAAATLWNGDRMIGSIHTDNLFSKQPLSQHQLDLLGLYGLTLGHLCTRKRTEEALRQAHDELEQRVEERTTKLRIANEEVKRFAYIVSHDLRAPLVNIKGFTGELRLGLETLSQLSKSLLVYLDTKQQTEWVQVMEADIPEALNFVNASAERMDYFTNAILQLSRLGRRQLRLERICTQEVIRNLLDSLAHQITERQAKVTIGALPDVVADRTALEQIFGNILTNAVMYLDPQRSGEIGITGEQNAGETIFHIRDNGRGIAEEDHHKVFEPFRRAGKPTVPGEGMGLAYVQTLIRRHGGKIGFTSQANVGTTFSFTISHDITEEPTNG